jgi:predicted DNA-binding protein YlxM (UPF0122 family)
MKAPSKVIQTQIEKGTPLSLFAIEKLKTAGHEDALRENAHNIVVAMLEGKSIRQFDLDQAMIFFPEQANEWLSSGGKVKEEKAVAEWTSIYAIAKELNVSEQSIHQMIKRNITVAPRPNSQGKYNRTEVKEFVANRAYNTSRGSKDYKQKILEQDFRLKKIKADEAENLLIPRDEVFDLVQGIDIAVEAFSVALIDKLAHNEKEKEEGLKYAKAFFKNWRDSLASLVRYEGK